MKLLRAAARTTALARYLQDFRKEVGHEAYFASVIRKEHGTGSGFFGVSNSGSRDCLKESIRGVTDALGFTYRTPHLLHFRTESCVGLGNFDKKVHRVEHTIEVRDLYLDLERQFILVDGDIELAAISEWILTNQITCWISQVEQKKQGTYSYDVPFSKYNAEVINRHGQIVSDYQRTEILSQNQLSFADEISACKKPEASVHLEQAINSFSATEGRAHTLPRLGLAIDYHDDPFQLLRLHYHHKRAKRTDPRSRWYSELDAQKYLEWENSLG